jgi:fido (protein-threonine AMPylation protein)
MPLPPELDKNLNEWLRVELTYTSNAIEGNSLTRGETALVVEKGLAVNGKSLNDIQEARNTAEAWDYVRTLFAGTRDQVDAGTILDIHSLILKNIDDGSRGRFRTVPVRISGSELILPNAAKVPGLIDGFIAWLHGGSLSDHPVKVAVDAHYKLVSIHPFTDGNGRTSRLLMSLLLAQSGYPPINIKPEDRSAYIDALEKAHMQDDFSDYYRFMYSVALRSIVEYLAYLEGDELVGYMSEPKPAELLKIGSLAKMSGESVPAIRFWTNEGLLKVKEVTPTGYQLYSPGMVDRVRSIRRLQREKRLTISEIKEVMAREDKQEGLV